MNKLRDTELSTVKKFTGIYIVCMLKGEIENFKKRKWWTLKIDWYPTRKKSKNLHKCPFKAEGQQMKALND